ncbi:uncharacterized protein LOC142323199 isoform X3 [Lycorma delicatula]|uniref:uncharacterized protein LOC142323199 isoform X3 n=1 Tax=Lycorma delicatula TaxID=130591 RepID=UPI003F516D22
MAESNRIPIVYVYDADNNAEPYWQMMVGDISELCDDDSSNDEEGKQVVVGVCAMAKKSQSKPMKEILTRLQEFEYIKMIVFAEEVILKKPVEEWPMCDCLISFHSKGFPLDKAIQYAALRNPFIINNLHMQYDIQDRRKVYSILESEGIEIPRYAVLDRDSSDPRHHELIESEDHVEVNGVVFNKPFVEKPVSAEDHNIYIYYPTSAGGGSQRLFRKIGSRSSVYSPESRVRKTGSFIYEDFMPTDGTDVKVYTVGPDYAHAEARKSPALDGKVERDSEGKEVRYPVILSNTEKLISRKVCLAFKQTVCGFDLLRANGKSFVCDVNGFSFVKNSNKYYDDCAKILGNMILRELAPTLHIPWSVPFQLDDPPIVPTTFGKMMELRCVVAVIRHGDRTPKQKMKVEVRHPKFFEIFEKYGGRMDGHVKLKRPKQLQEILDIARSLLSEIEHRAADPEIEEKQGKLEQLKSVLEMYGHFSGINRKVQMKYQPKGRPRGSSSDDVCCDADTPKEPSLVLILKWGGELTPAGRIQAEELGKIFRCMYPGGQGRHAGGEYAGKQGLGLLRLHSTFRHDLKIYASDEGRVQMTAAAFAKGLLALEGELTPILVQMVKSANTNGLLDNDCDASKHQNMAKAQLHELMQQNRDFTPEDRSAINPCNAISISMALDFVKNPVKCCERVQDLIQKLMNIVRAKRDDPKTKDAVLYHGETWELMGRRWGKIEKDFCTKNKTFDISKIPDIYDCIKYDLQHNQHTLQFDQAEELYINAKYLADIVIPQEYGLTVQEKLTISQGICTPLLKKIRADLQRNIEETGDETVNRLNPRYSHGVSSPGRHVRTRLYFTSESHVHSLLTVLRYGGLIDNVKDEQWRRAMEYVSMVSELNYMSQVVVMLYEDPTKDPSSEERFHVELHFSPGVNCCVQKNLPPGPGFRPHSRNEQSAQSPAHQQQQQPPQIQQTQQQQLGRIDQEDTGPEDSSSSARSDSPGIMENSPPAEKKTEDNSSYRQNLKSSQPIPINIGRGNGDDLLTDMFVQSDADQTKRSLSFSQNIHPARSPQHEPRSRSFDHSRDNSSHHKGEHPDLITEKIPWETFNSMDNMNEKHKKYVRNLFVFNDEQISKYMRKNIKRVEVEDKVSSKSAFQSLPNSRFAKLSSRFSHINSSVAIRSRSLDLIDENIHTGTAESQLSSSVDFPSVRSKKTVDLQSLDLAHVQVLTHRRQEIAGKNINLNKNRNLDIVAGKTLKMKLLDLKNLVSDYSSEVSKTTASLPSGKNDNYLKLNEHEYIDDDYDHNNIILGNKFFYKTPNAIDANAIYNTNLDDDKTFSKDPYLNEQTENSFIIKKEFSANAGENLTLNSKNHRHSLDSLSETVSKSFVLPPIAETKSCYALDKTKSDFSSTPKQKNLCTPVPRLTCERRTHSVSHCMDLTHLSPPEPGPSRRHRHSISGQMSYFRMTGYGLMIQHQRRGGGSTNSLFSTAVISGSSSAPNLRDMIPNTAAVAAAIEGCGGVPPIRPLETLHNALSLRQIDAFLDKMTRTTPPKHPSTPLTQSIQSPNNSMGWSGPPSFVSSSGPSSPNGLSDFLRGGLGNSDSSDFSASISNDGFGKIGQGLSGSSIADIGGTDDGESDDVCYTGHRDSLEIMELFNWNQQQQQLEELSDNMHFSPINPATGNLGDSGDVTPVSVSSEIDKNEFAHITCGEDDDEEKTLTAFTKEEMSRPSLAEIKWSQDDNTNENTDSHRPQRFAYGRFECIGALPDLETHHREGGHRYCSSSMLEQQGSSTASACEAIFEMDTDVDCDVKITTDAESNDCYSGTIPRTTDRRYSEMSTRNVSPCSSESGSPVVTVAGSLKDGNCISRGFIIRDDENKFE